MSSRHPGHRLLAAWVCLVVGASAGLGSATAAVITATPTLPLLGVPYVATSGGAGCFAVAAVCIEPGAFTLTSVLSSDFNADGQDIVTTASFTGLLTTLSHVPLGLVSLSGTIEQLVLGRTTSTELGSWATELVGLSLSGPVLGHTLSLILDPAHTSSGETSIAPIGDPAQNFRVDSFFDVFVELSLDTLPPLTTTRGPLHVVAVPEPSTLALLAAVVGIGGWRRRGFAALPPTPLASA